MFTNRNISSVLNKHELRYACCKIKYYICENLSISKKNLETHGMNLLEKCYLSKNDLNKIFMVVSEIGDLKLLKILYALGVNLDDICAYKYIGLRAQNNRTQSKKYYNLSTVYMHSISNGLVKGHINIIKWLH
jgi:hypothetical protein